MLQANVAERRSGEICKKRRSQRVSQSESQEGDEIGEGDRVWYLGDLRCD